MEQFAKTLVENFDLEKVIKGFFVVGLLMYSAFALIILRQVGVMNETIEAKYNNIVKIFAWAHLFLALGLVGLAMMVL